MPKLNIIKDPNPILRAETHTVSSFDGELQELIDNMIYTMRSADGIGLAAPQVGEGKKIIVAEYQTPEKSDEEFPLCVVINPKIEKLSDNQEFMVEGCLSFPGKELYIKRPKKVLVRALDRWGKEYTIEDEKLLSRVLQHEIDHLNGILMIDHIKSVKTVFVGSGTLGLSTLKRITSDPQFNLLAVVTSTDRKGDKGNLTPTIISNQAKSFHSQILKFEDINSKKSIEKIKKLEPELIIVADFSQILSQELIALAKYGVLNIHPSLLPKYRGPSPIISAILAGEKRTGVSIIKLNEKIDAGDILSQLEVKIKPRETARELKQRLADFAADLLAETVPYLLAGEIQPIKQKEEFATETKKISKENGRLTGDEDVKTIDRMVRALNPWPGVWQEIKEKKVFITKAHINKDKKLVIDQVKPEGKNLMSYKDYLNGWPPLTVAN